MINGQLRQIVRLIENISERDADVDRVRRRNDTPLDAGLCAPIMEYLVAPYKEGYWELKAIWEFSSPLSQYLIQKLGTLDELEKDESDERLSPSTLARKLPEERRSELLRLTSRISAINLLFITIKKKLAGERPPRAYRLDLWVDKIDPVEFGEKFKEAMKIFEDEIFSESFDPGVSPNRLSRTKTGLISFLRLPRTSSALHIGSARKTDVCTMQKFYSAIGVIREASVSRVFAPDENLFKPYFAMVSGVLANVIDDRQISTVFTRALEYYEDDDFQHCVSTLGLIAEDYLQRIYVSLIREQIPGNLTLGQTLDRLHKRIEENFPPTKIIQINFDGIHDKIKRINTDSGDEILKPLFRELVELIQIDRSHYGRRFDEITKPQSRRTPFPSHIGECLNELLKWRNAASHNSRVPLGAHEADRTLYCLVSLITWWQKQVATLDWSKSKLELIEMLIEAAKVSSPK